MQSDSAWTRRRLLKVGGLSVGAGVASRYAAACLTQLPQELPEHQDAYVYLASAASTAEEQGVHVFRVHHHQWEPLQFVRSRIPSSLVISADGRTLFVTNRIDSFQNLPTGSVESWRIDANTGRLTLRSRQGLALTAIQPSHAAASEDGSKLAVSAADGSLCVLLPVRKDGCIGEPVAVRKELRAATQVGLPSHPQAAQLCFAPDGQLLVADFAQRCLSVFACTSGSLEHTKRVMMPNASASVSFVQQTCGLEVRLHDDSARELAAFAYAGQQYKLTQGDVSSWQPTIAWLAHVSSKRTTCVHVAANHGSCLIMSEGAEGLDPSDSQALAWVHT